MTAPPLSALPDVVDAQIGADAETLVLLGASDRPMTLVRERAQDVTLRLRLPEDSVRVLYDLSLAGVIPFPGPVTDTVPPGPEIEGGAWDVHGRGPFLYILSSGRAGAAPLGAPNVHVPHLGRRRRQAPRGTPDPADAS